MIPEIENGQHVKCMFKNNSMVEGIVDGWNTNLIQLRSLSDQSMIFIINPQENLMMIKVMPLEEAEESLPIDSNLKEQISSKIKKVIQTSSNDTELLKLSVKELKHLAWEQERKMIADKIRNHFPNNSSTISNYNPQISIIANPKGTNG